jgi:hypothetical protein
MSVALMTVFAVSIFGALGMAVYGLGVLIGRWEQPRRLRRKQLAAPPPLVKPIQAPPIQAPSIQARAPELRIWVSPAGVLPHPMVVPAGMATPPPINVPVPDLRPAPSPPAPPAFVRPSTRPTRPEIPARLARGSIPPDLALESALALEQELEMEQELELEPDTDPGVPVNMLRSEPVVQRGARFSVIRSSRR